MSENSDKYRRAIAGFSSIVDTVPAGRWSNPSPCEGWSARDVVGHVMSGSQMISGIDFGVAHDRANPGTLAGDDPAANFVKASEAAFAALTEDNLSKKVQGPMGEMPLDQILGMFLTNDVLIHTWDLAHAAQLPVTLDPQLVEEAYTALQPIDGMIRTPGVFGPKVEPPANADLQTKLICFTGRHP